MSIIYHGTHLGWTITADNTKPVCCQWRANKYEVTVNSYSYDSLIELIKQKERDKYLYPSWKQNDY
mgnify:CR=1 FL=1